MLNRDLATSRATSSGRRRAATVSTRKGSVAPVAESVTQAGKDLPEPVGG
jgi:hypothetical protein